MVKLARFARSCVLQVLDIYQDLRCTLLEELYLLNLATCADLVEQLAHSCRMAGASLLLRKGMPRCARIPRFARMLHFRAFRRQPAHCRQEGRLARRLLPLQLHRGGGHRPCGHNPRALVVVIFSCCLMHNATGCCGLIMPYPASCWSVLAVHLPDVLRYQPLIPEKTLDKR